MKNAFVLSTVAALAVGLNLHAQNLGNAPEVANNQSGFYHPLALAPAENESAGGGGGGRRAWSG